MNGRPASGHAAANSSLTAANLATDLAKAAFRRLARSQLEPTPENYARAYAQEAGTHGDDAATAAADGESQVEHRRPTGRC